MMISMLRFVGSTVAALVLLVLVLTLAQARSGRILTRITTASDGDRDSTYPSLSADGAKIAFVSDSDFLNQGIPGNDNVRGGGPVGQFEIWLYDTATMTVTRITTASTADRDSWFPSLSADGTKVAFESDSDFLGQNISLNQFEIWLYDTATMAVTRITTASDGDRDSNYPSLSGDGAKIAFVSDSDFLNQGIPNDQFEIWLYDTAAMTVTRLTTTTAAGRSNSAPSLSADGTKIAFVSDSDFLNQGIPNDQFEVWLYDTATMTVTRITTASSNDRDSFSPSVSADGTKVVFWSNSDFLDQAIPPDQFEVWLYDTATMTVTRITTASDSGRSSSTPALSGDGTKIAFISDSDFLEQGIENDQYEVWLYDTATMTVTRLTNTTTPGRRHFAPGLNADGARVAFYSDADFFDQGIPAEQSEIWLATVFEVTGRTYLPLASKN